METLARNVKVGTIGTALTVNGSYAFPDSLGQYNNISLTLIGANTAAMVVKIKASKQQTAPDFSAAVSPTNSWFYVQTINNATGNSVPGATGYTFVANGEIDLEINTDIVNYVAIEISAFATGDMTVLLEAANNT